MLIATLAGSVTQHPTGCQPGRNRGKPTPTWWPFVRELIIDNIRYFPPSVSIEFLGAWVEHESDGRNNVKTHLDEVGYFQIHPAEIEDIAGKEHVQEILQLIQTNKVASVRWGGMLLSYYDRILQKLGLRRGTTLYLALLKQMHASPPRTKRWIQHVQAVLGENPRSFDEFVDVAEKLKSRAVKPRLDKSIPKVGPSCSSYYLLDRMSAFPVPAWSLPGEAFSFVLLGTGLLLGACLVIRRS